MIPKIAFRADTEILKNEPDTHHIVTVGEFKGTDAQTANQVSREHASWCRCCRSRICCRGRDVVGEDTLGKPRMLLHMGLVVCLRS